MHMLKCEISQ